jgi:hypothetical protein
MEDAISAVLSASVAGLVVHNGQTSDDRTVPAAIVYASGARTPDDLDPFSGNYEVTIEVQVLSLADGEDALGSHRDTVSAVRDAIVDADLVEEFMPEDSILYDLNLVGDEEGREERKFGNTLTLSALVCLDIPLD